MHGFHLPLIHGDTLLIDDVAEELDFGLMVLAFLGFEEEIVFMKSLEDHLFNVSAMFGLASGVDIQY